MATNSASTPNGQVCAGHLEVGQFVYSFSERSSQFQLEVLADGAIDAGHTIYESVPKDRGTVNPARFDGKISELTISVVERIGPVERPDWVYNLEVEDNHNYFVRDILVSNCHMLSVSAFNAMLKTLEEPPPHVIFILATTDPQKIPATVLSRCQRFTFKRVPVEQIVGRLRHLCNEENIEADEIALRLIARYATGSLRDAVSLLDQLASSNSLRITANDVREALGATDAATVRALVDGLIAKDISKGFEAIQAAIDGGADARQIARQMVEYLRALMQIKVSDASGATRDLSEAERIELSAHAEKISIAQMTKAVRAFSEAINEMRGTADAQLPIEMAYLDCVVVEERLEDRREIANNRQQTIETRVAPSMREESRPTPTTPAKADATVPVISTTSDTEGGLSFEAVKGQWRQLIKEVDAQNKPAAALLRSCHLHDVTGNLVSIRADHDLFRQRLDEARNKNAVISVLNRMFNGKYDVRVFVNTSSQNADPDDDPVVKAAKKQGGVVRQG